MLWDAAKLDGVLYSFSCSSAEGQVVTMHSPSRVICTASKRVGDGGSTSRQFTRSEGYQSMAVMARRHPSKRLPEQPTHRLVKQGKAATHPSSKVQTTSLNGKQVCQKPPTYHTTEQDPNHIELFAKHVTPIPPTHALDGRLQRSASLQRRRCRLCRITCSSWRASGGCFCSNRRRSSCSRDRRSSRGGCSLGCRRSCWCLGFWGWLCRWCWPARPMVVMQL